MLKDLFRGNCELAFKTARKIGFVDPRTGFPNYNPARVFLCARDFRGALNFMERNQEFLKKYINQSFPSVLAGIIYLKNGMKEKADRQFYKAISYYSKNLKEDNPYSSGRSCYYLMYCWSAMDEKQKAKEYLKQSSKYEDLVFTVNDFIQVNSDPGFDLLREEPGFKEFIKKMEVRFKNERSKIEGILMKENSYSGNSTIP
jgi:tetratricopeptide (TPR) repeat protein